jgi:hypothetical protein
MLVYGSIEGLGMLNPFVELTAIEGSSKGIDTGCGSGSGNGRDAGVCGYSIGE